MPSAAKLDEPLSLSPATKQVALPSPFPMRRGGVLPRVQIAYETWGTLNSKRDNAVLLFTGLSPSAHATSSPQDPTPGWWEFMIGPGRPIDTREYHVVCVNSLGSCFGSTGPASIDRRTARPYRLRFPALTIEDIARAAHEALGALDIQHLRAVVGASLGGMSALAFAIEFPEKVDSLVTISAATHAAPYAIAIRSLQREMIRSDPAWNGGDYAPGAGPIQGMRLARKLGLTSYGSALVWQQRFGNERVPDAEISRQAFGVEFQIESYLDANARKFVGNFDANCYLHLSRTMDWFDMAEHGGTRAAGIKKIRARRSLVVGVESDILYPTWQQREIAELLQRAGRDVTFVALPSEHGHDSFLIDKDRFGPVVADFFSGARSQG